MSKRNKPKGKRINPTYWVFCEGKTEETYVTYLRTKYRLPIVTTCKVAGSNISQSFIKKSKQGRPTDPKDRDFLIYDGDVRSTMERLKKIDSLQLIVSNPSIELWFLYHYKNQQSEISGEDCERQLTSRNGIPYRKGTIDKKLKTKLDSDYLKACERAKKSLLFENPSSNVYLLIEELERIKNDKSKP